MARAEREIKVVVFEHSTKYVQASNSLSGLNLTCPESASSSCGALGCVHRGSFCVLNVIDRMHNEGAHALNITKEVQEVDSRASPGMLQMPRERQEVEDIIQRLSKGDVVVTSSYHGTWWATLLGKAVVVTQTIARSSRVKLFRYPATVYSGNLYHDQQRATLAAMAHPFPEVLRMCRKLNELFYSRVLCTTARHFRAQPWGVRGGACVAEQCKG
jgi:hypothetical protein